MRLKEAKELFLSITKEYFSSAIVIFSNQSRVAKPSLPLITLHPLNLRRHKNAIYTTVDGLVVASYHSRIPIQVDLFTKGAPVIDDETGKIVAYDDTAVEDLTEFVDFLDSLYVLEWSHNHDVSIDIEGEVQNLTGIVNDTNYEFRARVTVLFDFIHRTVGSASVLKEVSIQYPVVKPDMEEPAYTPEKPLTQTSNTGSYVDEAEKQEENAIVVPEFSQTSTGGGSEELAAADIGYFTEVEIKEEEETVNE